MAVVLTFILTVFLCKINGGYTCTENDQLSVAKAIQKISPMSPVVFYDLSYENGTNMGEAYAYHQYLGDIEDLDERWDALNDILDQAQGEDKIIVVMGNQMLQDRFRSNKHYWLIQNTNNGLENMPILRFDSLVFHYNCSGDDITVNELYAIKGNIVNGKVGTVPKEKDTMIFQMSSNIWQRRRDLLGTTLINSYLPYPTLNMPILNEAGETIGHTGYMAEILETLGTILNFKVEWTQPPIKSWGRPTGNGSYDGILGQLMDGSADMSSAGLGVSSDRMEIIDFTVFTFEFVISITTCRQGKAHQVNMEAFVDLFTSNVWITYAILVCILVLTWVGINSIQSNGNFNFSSALATVGKVSMQSSVDIDLTYSATKALIVVTSFYGFLIYVHYTANLTTLMTTGPPPLKLKSFRDILEMDMDVIVWKGGTPSKIMAQAKEGTALHEAHKKMLGNPEKGFLTSQDAITKELRTNPNSVYYGPFYAFVKDPKFKIFMVDEMVGTHAGFGLAKDSEFRELFDYHLAKLRETGTDKLLKLKHITSSEELNFEQEALTLGFENLFLPSTILALGTTFAVILSFVEFSSRFKPRRTKHLHTLQSEIF